MVSNLRTADLIKWQKNPRLFLGKHHFQILYMNLKCFWLVKDDRRNLIISKIDHLVKSGPIREERLYAESSFFIADYLISLGDNKF